MAKNKIIYGNETLIDLTSDTVSPNNLLLGETAHDRSGESIQGNVVIPTVNDSEITIQKNGVDVDSFTLNQSTNKTINITMSKSDVGLNNVPNVSTNDQTPTFTEASTRANIASGEKLSVILGKIKKFFTDLKAVAFSGSYNDLTDQPTIPTVNNATLTIQKNGTNVQTFTANASSNKTANIIVPTKTSDLTNDSDFVTSTDLDNKVSKSGDTMSGNLKFSAGKSIITTDKAGKDYYPIRENGANLWIGASEGAGVHHAGSTYISTGVTYNSSEDGVGNTTAYLSIPTYTKSTNTWSQTGKRIAYHNATPTSGKVMISDGTAGGIKSSDYTIKANVPEEAVFTDTTYSFTGGTNKFTVTPSSGSAYDVTVTPSISNNITGSGTRTSGYLAKFSGTNTVTNGPQLGSDTTKFLSNAGTWLTPSDVTGNAATATKLQTARSIGLDGDFQGSANFDGSANATIDAYFYNKSCTSSNKANFPYHRIAHIEGVTGTYQDRDAILFLRGGYNGGPCGMIRIVVRSNAAGASVTGSAFWLFSYGFTASDVVIAIKGTTGNFVADVFLKRSTYARTTVYQMMGNRQWELIASNEVSDTTASDKKTSTEVYSTVAQACIDIYGSGSTYTATANSQFGSFVKGTDLPRVTKDSQTLPDNNQVIFEEYKNGANYNLPTNHYYHIISMKGDSDNYGTQLALGMTTTGAYYRAYINQEWTEWQNLITAEVARTLKSATMRPTNANVQYGDGGLRHYLASSSMTSNKPNSSDGNIIHLPWDNTGGYDKQLYISSTAIPKIYARTQSAGTWNNWQPVAVFGQTAPTSGRIVVTDGTEGKVSASSYTILTSVPADAVFTDTKVRQTLALLDNTNRPLLLSYANNSSSTENVDNISYRCNTIYANASTGKLHVGTLDANELTGDLAVSASAITIANGDRLVITHNSDNSDKLNKSSITFDATTETQCLTKAGTWKAFNNYSLPAASSTTRGGIKIGYSESGTNYAVKLSSEKAYVTVPWTDTRSVFYGTCATAATERVKEVTLNDDTGFSLTAGVTVYVKFSNTNTYSSTSSSPTQLKVGSTAAKNIYYGGSSAPTGTNTTAFGRKDYINAYTYNGSYWVWIGSSADNNTTYSSKTAASGGTDTSLCTTGEKYTWNSKAAGNHTHTTSIDTAGSGSTIYLEPNTNYTLTAGGTSCNFYTPSKVTVAGVADTFEDYYYLTMVNSNAGNKSLYNSNVLAYIPKGHKFFVDKGTGAFIQCATQFMAFGASNEANYRVALGVLDSKWGWMPETHGKLNLGTTNHRWDTVYANTGTINTSDRNEKKDIVDLDENARNFILSLKPVSYKLKDGNTGRTHYGMIAQDVEEELEDLGMTPMDFAGFCKDQKTTPYEVEENGQITRKDMPIEGEYTYGLRYEEFIAPMIKTIQLQQEEINELKQQLAEIKTRLDGGN